MPVTQQVDNSSLLNIHPVTIEEFATMIEQCKNKVLVNRKQYFEQKAYTEHEIVSEALEILDKINILISRKIVTELKRLGKFDENYEKVISDGRGLKSKISHWNKNIPNLHIFLENSFAELVAQDLFFDSTAEMELLLQNSLKFNVNAQANIEKIVASNKLNMRIFKDFFIGFKQAMWLTPVIIVIVYLIMMSLGSNTTNQIHTKTDNYSSSPAENNKSESNPLPNMYSLQPFIAQIPDGNEQRYLKISMDFELTGAGARSESDMRLSAIRDSISAILSTKSLQDIQDIQGKNQLKEEIITAVNKIFSARKITKIYFTDFEVR